MNSSYCNCNAANHEKNVKQFFSQREFNSSALYFSTLYFSTLYPNDIHILFIHCILLSKGVLLIVKITWQNIKNVSQFLKKNFCLQQTKSLAALSIFIVKWVSNDNSNTALKLPLFSNHYSIYACTSVLMFFRFILHSHEIKKSKMFIHAALF